MWASAPTYKNASGLNPIQRRIIAVPLCFVALALTRPHGVSPPLPDALPRGLCRSRFQPRRGLSGAVLCGYSFRSQRIFNSRGYLSRKAGYCQSFFPDTSPLVGLQFHCGINCWTPLMIALEILRYYQE